MATPATSARPSLEELTLSQTNTRTSDPKSILTTTDSPPRIELVMSGRVLDDMAWRDNQLYDQRTSNKNYVVQNMRATLPSNMNDNTSNAALINRSSRINDGTLEEPQKRGLRFWLCIVAIMMASFLIILDMVSRISYTTCMTSSR